MTAEQALPRVTITQQEACMVRELANRKRLLAVQVNKGAITRPEAERQLRELEAVLHTISLVRSNRLQPAPSPSTQEGKPSDGSPPSVPNG